MLKRLQTSGQRLGIRAEGSGLRVEGSGGNGAVEHRSFFKTTMQNEILCYCTRITTPTQIKAQEMLSEGVLGPYFG